MAKISINTNRSVNEFHEALKRGIFQCSGNVACSGGPLSERSDACYGAIDAQHKAEEEAAEEAVEEAVEEAEERRMAVINM